MTTYALANTTTQWFSRAWPGSRINPNCGVLHTTEGTDWPTYDAGAKAPNYTARPDFKAKRLLWRAHFPDEMSSRALRNEPGGVETNTLNAIQVELIGTCARLTRDQWVKAGRKQDVDFIFWAEPPAWALQQLAEFIADMNRRHGIPITGPAVWMPYPASYGKTVNRMTFAQWRAFKGWCGHQHVPENDHGDPGSLPWATVAKLAQAIVAPPKPVTAFERIATLNVLGSHHTDPGGKNAGMDSGEVRMLGAIRALNHAGVTVCALQELETPQADVIESRKRWSLIRAVPNNTFRNGVTMGNGLMYRKDIWTCLETHDLPVAISGKRLLHLPVLALRHKVTGLRLTLVVDHSPSKGPISGGTDTDRSRMKQALLTPQADVILGDFNEARGVTLPGYTIQAHNGPDWIFTRHLIVDEPQTLPFKTAGISDHNAVTARLTLTASRP